MSIAGHDTIVDNIERKYDIRGVESEEKGLFYLEDNYRKSIGIMTCRSGQKSVAILTKKQAYALIEEFKDICDMYFKGW